MTPEQARAIIKASDAVDAIDAMVERHGGSVAPDLLLDETNVIRGALRDLAHLYMVEQFADALKGSPK